MSTTPGTGQNAYYNATTHTTDISGFPKIRGTWFFVDPLIGLSTNSGLTPSNPVDSIVTAYGLATDGAGDGICLLSSGSTTASTTSYLAQSLSWAKNGITLFGVCADNGIYQRARVASKDYVTGPITTISQQANSITRTTGNFLTDGWVVGMKGYIADSGSNNGATFTVTVATALVLTIAETINVQSAAQVGSCTMTSYCPYLISITSANNLFQNVSFENVGSQAGAIGGMILTGAQRNQFNNVFVYGGGGCTAVATTRSLEIGAGSNENYFFDSTIGTDTVDRGNYANAEIYINADTTTGRNYFYNCWILSMTSTGTAHGAIKSAGAAAYGRHLLFENCVFVNYTPNLGADQTSLFIGTGFNTAKILLVNTSICGYAYADSSTTNKCVYTQGGPTILTTGLGGVMVTKTT